jgi:hypothetical protein
LSRCHFYPFLKVNTSLKNGQLISGTDISLYFLENQNRMLITNSFRFAYQSPRVAGNAVYMARVLLGLMIIDTETYAAKSTQISSTNTSLNLKIYPNPSNDFFNYFLPLKEEDKGIVSIIDVSGKKIQTWSADYSSNQGLLDIQRYAKGIYVFELTINGNQKLNQKLIIK